MDTKASTKRRRVKNELAQTITETNNKRDQDLATAFTQITGNIGAQQQQLSAMTEQLKLNEGRSQNVEHEIQRLKNQEETNRNISFASITGMNNAERQTEKEKIKGAGQEQHRRSKLNDALKFLTKEYLFDGDSAAWISHRKKLENLIWSNELTSNEAIRLIKLSFTGNALHLIDNVDAQKHLNSICDDPARDYLDELEALFISTNGKELTRVQFQTAKQSKDELAMMWGTRLKCLYKLAYPSEDEDVGNNDNLTDRFVGGLYDQQQKKFVLEHKKMMTSYHSFYNYASNMRVYNGC